MIGASYTAAVVPWRAALLIVPLVLACGPISEEASTGTTGAQSTTTMATTTTKRNTTTTRPTTTTTLSVEQERQILADSFDGVRGALIDELEANPHIHSVDNVDYARDRDEVVVAVTTSYSTPEINEDIAWELTTEVLRPAWAPDGPIAVVPFPVGLALEVSDLSFRCPGDFMLRLGDHRATRSDWLAACT